MKTRTSLALGLLVLSSHALGNEMFSTPPTRYDISGQDIYGHDAYEIHAFVQKSDKKTKLIGLTVHIYDERFDVPKEVLAGVYDPDFGKVTVANDAGIFGSIFYIQIPFAEIGHCNLAKRESLRKSIHISSLGIANKSGVSAQIHDPCK